MRPILLLSCCILVLSCAQPKTSKIDIRQEEETIRALLKTERSAHFDRDVEAFISEFADSMINVNRGLVKAPSKEEHRERVGRYFGSVEFKQWDDIREPVIRFSDDGSLAYAIVQKRVVVSYPDTLGRSFVDTTDYAWASIYRKQNGQWKVEANISTNK